jgi:hypothetical protein
MEVKLLLYQLMSHGGKTAHFILQHWMGMNDQFHVLVGWGS